METINKKIYGEWKFDRILQGPYDEHIEFISTTKINSKIMKYTIIEKNLKENNEYKVSTDNKMSWSAVDIELSCEVNNTTENMRNEKIEEKIKNEKSIENKNTFKRKIKLTSNDKIYIYKLIYKDDEIDFYYETDIISQVHNDGKEELEKRKENPITIKIKVEKIKLLKDIKVVYTEKVISRPNDIIMEVDNLNKNYEKSDINHMYSGKYVWLEPIPTYIIDEAATDIKIQFDEKSDNGNNYDLAKSDGKDIFRYLKIKNDENLNKKIKFDSVKLFRTNDKDSKPTRDPYNYENYTRDINEDRDYIVDTKVGTPGFLELPGKKKKHDYLYLCWDTITF